MQIKNFIIKQNKSGLKSGEIVLLYILLPKLFIEKRGGFKSGLQVSFDFFRAFKPLACFVKNRQRKQFLLSKFFSKVWFFRFFLAKVLFCSFSKTKLKTNAILFFRIKKVGVFFVSLLTATNVVGLFSVKNTSKRYRRKALYFLVKNFKEKRRRLTPLRRMNRKKKKNK